MQIKILKIFTASLLLSAMLVGCGGSDNNSSSNSNNSNTSPNNQVSAPAPSSSPTTNTQEKVILNISANIYNANGVKLDNAKIDFMQNNNIITSVNTDNIGHLNNLSLSVVKNTDVIASISKDGYTKQVKILGNFTNINSTDSNVTKISFEAFLLKPNLVTTISLLGSGNAKVNINSTSVEFSKDSFIDESGKLVTGNIDVNITVLNPQNNPQSFSGNTSINIGSATSPQDGQLVSLGMVDFSFSQNGKKIQLTNTKNAEIIIPMFGVYNSKGKMLEVGDSIPFWTMNDKTGIWTQEGDGIVIDDKTSPTGLSVKGKVSHFSWWNLDYGVPIYRKPIEIYYGSQCKDRYTQNVNLSAFYYQSVDNGVFSGLSSIATSTLYQGAGEIRIPADYNLNIISGYSHDNLYEIAPKAFTVASMQNEPKIKLCLINRKPSLTIYPAKDTISMYAGQKLQLQYMLDGLDNSAVKFYVDNIEGGNTSVGTIDQSGIYNTNGLSSSTHKIKIVSVQDSNVFDELTVNIIDNIKLKNTVLLNNGSYDLFREKINISATSGNTPAESPFTAFKSSMLINGEKNELSPYINDNKFPKNFMHINSIECYDNSAIVSCNNMGLSELNGNIEITGASKDINNLSLFHIKNDGAHIYPKHFGYYDSGDIFNINPSYFNNIVLNSVSPSLNMPTSFVRIKYSVLNKNYVQNFWFSKTHDFYLENIGTEQYTYKLDDFYINSVDTFAPIFKVVCIKDGSPCINNDGLPQVSKNLINKTLSLVAPPMNKFDSSAEYYLTGFAFVSTTSSAAIVINPRYKVDGGVIFKSYFSYPINCNNDNVNNVFSCNPILYSRYYSNRWES